VYSALHKTRAHVRAVVLIASLTWLDITEEASAAHTQLLELIHHQRGGPASYKLPNHHYTDPSRMNTR